MTGDRKARLVSMFLRGSSLRDTAAFFACRQTTAEQVLREAVTGLGDLNAALVSHTAPTVAPEDMTE